jgi:hypothetical protein
MQNTVRGLLVASGRGEKMQDILLAAAVTTWKDKCGQTQACAIKTAAKGFVDKERRTIFTQMWESTCDVDSAMGRFVTFPYFMGMYMRYGTASGIIQGLQSVITSMTRYPVFINGIGPGASQVVIEDALNKYPRYVIIESATPGNFCILIRDENAPWRRIREELLVDTTQQEFSVRLSSDKSVIPWGRFLSELPDLLQSHPVAPQPPSSWKPSEEFNEPWVIDDLF